MQLKHLETSTFKTYLGLAQIAKNMALMATSTEKKKKKEGGQRVPAFYP
jgi:hypothetical protein